VMYNPKMPHGRRRSHCTWRSMAQAFDFTPLNHFTSTSHLTLSRATARSNSCASAMDHPESLPRTRPMVWITVITVPTLSVYSNTCRVIRVILVVLMIAMLHTRSTRLYVRPSRKADDVLTKQMSAVKRSVCVARVTCTPTRRDTTRALSKIRFIVASSLFNARSTSWSDSVAIVSTLL
jgi:hypothetical protein